MSSSFSSFSSSSSVGSDNSINNVESEETPLCKEAKNQEFGVVSKVLLVWGAIVVITMIFIGIMLGYFLLGAEDAQRNEHYDPLKEDFYVGFHNNPMEKHHQEFHNYNCWAGEKCLQKDGLFGGELSESFLAPSLKKAKEYFLGFLGLKFPGKNIIKKPGIFECIKCKEIEIDQLKKSIMNTTQMYICTGKCRFFEKIGRMFCKTSIKEDELPSFQKRLRGKFVEKCGEDKRNLKLVVPEILSEFGCSKSKSLSIFDAMEYCDKF